MSEGGAPKDDKPRWTFISLALFVLGLLFLVGFERKLIWTITALWLASASAT